MIFPAINLHLFQGFSMAMLNNTMVISKKQSILLGMIMSQNWIYFPGIFSPLALARASSGTDSRPQSARWKCWSLKGLISGKFTLKWRSCRIFLAIFYTSNRTGSWNGHWFSQWEFQDPKIEVPPIWVPEMAMDFQEGTCSFGRSTLVFGSWRGRLWKPGSQAARQLGS